MLILLPPSEGKATSGTGPAVDPESLVLPALAPARREVLAALEELCSGPEDTALEVLGLTPGQAEAIKRDLDAATAPTLRAADLYTGVLYDRMGLPGLLREHPDRVRERVLIFSGLWGVVGPDDALPPYRLSMGVKLPPLGGLGAYWRKAMAEPLRELAADRLLVDCRSATYAAAFKPRGAAAERLVSVRVLRERVVDGRVGRSVVSHMAKATRGDIARSLLANGVEATDTAELAEALRDLGYTVETPGVEASAPRVLDVIVRDQDQG